MVRLLWQVSQHRTPHFADIVEHFKYGSIGAEPYSGIPYRIWRALPTLFPDEFKGRNDYSAFGFLYENDDRGRQRDVPIGIARRVYRGVEVVWFNCATCHAGTVSVPAAEGQKASRRVIPGMPSNNLDLHRFVAFLLEAGADERLSPDRLIAAINETGPKLWPVEKALYRFYIIPMLREGLVLRRSRLVPLLAQQPPWGPGRVDTFNPYKLHPGQDAAQLARTEGAGRRRGLSRDLHAGSTRRHESALGRQQQVARRTQSFGRDGCRRHARFRRSRLRSGASSDWLLELRAPPSPYRPDPAAVGRGRDIYMRACAACHGYQSEQGYIFKGERLGQVEPNAKLGADPHRLDSYTERFRAVQLSEFFKGTPYQFKEFKKTDGYANAPLDGLWLRAPYLHNGAVPTLADLLEPADKRPQTFVRGIDTLDPARGGFVAPPCGSAPPPEGAACFDTRRPGNGNGGHLYGTDLPANEKSDLLAYLLTF